MNHLEQKTQNNIRRKFRIRKRISGSSERPRLSVFISHNHVSAQIIDDASGNTLASVTTVGNKAAVGTMTEKSVWVGSEIASLAKKSKIKKIVFDRNGRLYHGRIKALAEKAREGGLEF